MSAVHDEYLSFLAWLPGRGFPEDTIRVAKVVAANLDRLIPTVSNRGQRAAILAPILRSSLPSTEPTLDEQVVHSPGSLNWTRLRLLSLGSFRGFRYEHRFNLDSRVVLFQGPNGNGKTSICEGVPRGALPKTH